MQERKKISINKKSGNKLKKQQASKKIFEALRLEISLGLLKPRERLIEQELCVKFDTSNHNIRQAFDLLDRVGLVCRKANCGVVVRAIDHKELNDLYNVRLILQREGVRALDLSNSNELVIKLSEINRCFKIAIDDKNHENMIKENEKFHMLIYEYCLNKELSELLHTYWLKASAITSHGLNDEEYMLQSIADHENIITAIKRGNLEQLIQVSVEHIRPAVELYKITYGLD
tara:strand:+ start:35 stop:727 length:693 start_codon:yes stop_codon:yes gene_type:complete